MEGESDYIYVDRATIVSLRSSNDMGPQSKIEWEPISWHRDGVWFQILWVQGTVQDGIDWDSVVFEERSCSASTFNARMFEALPVGSLELPLYLVIHNYFFVELISLKHACSFSKVFWAFCCTETIRFFDKLLCRFEFFLGSFQHFLSLSRWFHADEDLETQKLSWLVNYSEAITPGRSASSNCYQLPASAMIQPD